MQGDLVHHIKIIDDSSDAETLRYLKALCNRFNSDNIKADIVSTSFEGLMDSIRACYEYLRDQGDNLVFQVQDDYMFTKSAVYEMVDLFYQLYADKDTQSIISGYNCPGWYIGENKYSQDFAPSTPSLFICKVIMKKILTLTGNPCGNQLT